MSAVKQRRGAAVVKAAAIPLLDKSKYPPSTNTILHMLHKIATDPPAPKQLMWQFQASTATRWGENDSENRKRLIRE